MSQPKIIIIGAGPAGLAVAASLKKHGLEPFVLEEADRIAIKWHQHYDRLCLHTHKKFSSLPGLPFPKSYPMFVPRQQFVDYLEEYAKKFNLKPRFKTKVLGLKKEGKVWHIETNKGLLTADHVVLGTGRNRVVKNSKLEALKGYTGEIVHSSLYKNGSDFAGKRVLVVGAGNTGAEIALDLLKYKAKPFWCVRSPTYVVPLKALGTAAQVTNLRMSHFPSSVTDPISAFFLKFTIGDLSPYGIEKPQEGLREYIKKTGRVPVIDLGTVDAVKKGKIKVVKSLKSAEGLKINFEGDVTQEFDRIIVATGYSPGLSQLLQNSTYYEKNLKSGFEGIEKIENSEKIYFVGLQDEGTGLLYQINKGAERVAHKIATAVSSSPSFSQENVMAPM